MAKYTRIEVVQAMQATGLVPVFYHADVQLVKKILKAAYDAGARVFEFTNRGDFAHEVFGELNKFAIKELPEMMLGIGSVIDAPTAALYIQLGANFVVSPLLNADMAKVCNRRKIMWVPGCGSLSEINYAEELGAEVCKIFPAAQVGGPDFVKNVKAPCPWSLIMPTGGVEPDEENLRKWFNAGVCCVGMGSQLFLKKNIEANDFEAISNDIRNVLEMIKRIRK
jgi:2-dehydro-3-deoxyphosphogluconate aldolase/(4S)-4-hydroxy-2-oxoglutarate aldolase